MNNQTPNIVYFLVDDMGYGDVSCLNPNGKIKTPNIDRLAREGMIFTDAHSTSAVCSPSRYGILTGRYNWRSTLQRGIVGLYGKPIITEDRLTAGQFLRNHGYHTGCIGKWHLGMGWPVDDPLDLEAFCPSANHPQIDATDEHRAKWNATFSQPTTAGPTRRGFDYYFGVDVPNWPPYCFIENDRTVGIPSEFLPPSLVKENFMASRGGPAMPGWTFEQLLPTWTKKADEYIRDRAASGQPFFLYMPMTSPHTPLAVNEPWKGKSGLNHPYGDLVMETDHVLGQVLEALERYRVADNTLVIFTSDNGFAQHVAGEVVDRGHTPSADRRGYKSDAWDGGHRIPCVARWPGVIAPGSRCDQLVCLSDFMATCADILGQRLPDNAGEDSVSMMPLFCGQSTAIREHVVHHSWHGKFAIRDGRWKLVLCPGSGGWTHRDAEAAKDGLPLVQLYDMKADPGEKNNLCAEQPNRVRAMVALLKQIVEEGRSTAGPRQTNDAPVDLWKLDTMPDVAADSLDDYDSDRTVRSER